MDISSVNSDLIRGNVTTIILGCLMNEDKYGYEILKEIEDKSHSQYALKQATLYNQLKRLEKQGLVNSYDGAPDDTGGGKRRYYALTSEGKAYLTKEKSEYEYSRTILDKLVSEKEFDFTKEIPFDASELRPYSKREPGEEKPPKVVYKEKIVEVENVVYIDLFGNRITEEEARQAALQAMIDDEQARKNEKDLAEAREQLLALEQQRGSGVEQNLSFEEERAAYEAQLHAAELERAAQEEQLRLLEEERTAREERLHATELDRAAMEEQLRLLEEEKAAREEQLRIAEEERKAREEQLRAFEDEREAREERLHATELDRAAKEEQLRMLEEERTAREEELRAAEEERAAREEQLHATELDRAAKEEQLRILEEERDAREEKLRAAEEERSAREERLHATELDRAAKEEQLRLLEEEKAAKEEQLRATEEEINAKEEQLRLLEEEKAAKEEQLRAAELERDEANEQLRLYREQQLAEEERKRAAQLRPSANINELFAKLELESEYQRSRVVEQQQTAVVEEVAVEAEPIPYAAEPIPYVEEQPRRQASMQDIFRFIDEKKAQHAEESARERAIAQAAADNEYYESDLPNSGIVANPDGVTSAVIGYNEQGFAYENASVNYRDFFYSIDENQQPKPELMEQPKQQPQYSDDIKTRLYAKGFKVRPYDRGNTSEYYTYNFVQSNRINRDTFLIILALFVVEVAVMWVSLASRISYKYFLPVLLVGSALCLVPTVLYLLNPNKRTRANFNFKLSILNRTMLFIELSVVCILIGFFALGASVKDIDIILSAIILPAVLLLDLPISSIVYYLLYRTHKYHIS